MPKIFLRGLDTSTASRIRADARRHKMSVSQRIGEVLRAHFAGGVFDDLDGLVGTWSEAEATAFEAAIAPFTLIVKMSASSPENGSRTRA